jgi:hypothetical protein
MESADLKRHLNTCNVQNILRSLLISNVISIVATTTSRVRNRVTVRGYGLRLGVRVRVGLVWVRGLVG